VRLRTSTVLSGVAIASPTAVIAALVTQYGFDMQPCAWCVLQRLEFLLIGAVAALALLLRIPLVRSALGAVLMLLAGCGAASALYQHFVAARSTSCRFSLAEQIIGSRLHLDSLLPSVFGVRATCADAAVTLLGIPYEFLSLALFVLIALAGAFVVYRGFRPERGL
jgi:disulfide bond formation protein DsbB